MTNGTEQEEREYLEIVKEKLLIAIRRADESVKQFSTELRQNKEYIYENQSGMDEADMVSAGQSINRMAYTGESAVAQKRKLLKLVDSPYFGRIDFVTGESPETNLIYIGIHSFADQSRRVNLIYDWRAPISSMFYDYELGKASYDTPSGPAEGEIVLKRQYRITEGRMEFMLENAVSILDDVLQEELSRSSDDRMKNIVATIQRDQNAVIRNETARVMIIQGVAGSGKTSIALHRIAFLLYRFRETVKATDILIISPNKVFADYISNVLPELGEEHIPEIGMEDLASEMLEHKYQFQTFFEQVTLLLEEPDPAFIERIGAKASFEFLSKLNQYLIHIENYYFTFTELRIAGTVVPFPFIEERFKAYHRIPLLKRFPEVVKDIQNYLRNNMQRKLNGREKAQLWEAVPRMFKLSNVIDLYEDFYSWIKKPHLFKMEDNILEYADVFPLIYFKIRLEGLQSRFDHVKHLLVDEMQDYTPVQYAVLSRIFHCKKTILGDVSQTVNPYSASSAETIEKIFPQADIVKLFRSYRSTWEITAFSQNISRNPSIIPMERHGEPPSVRDFDNNAAEIAFMESQISRFKDSPHASMGIVCKTQEQANVLYDRMKSPGVHLLTADSSAFTNGVIIASVHLSKGLEFDVVVIPFASANNYHTDVDRSMLYIACTRAMHELTLTYSKQRSPFVPGE
jgi:DNA helicase-2/ATP-dependent DNA helicase PcrA